MELGAREPGQDLEDDRRVIRVVIVEGGMAGIGVYLHSAGLGQR
jgi:hypothetical protein